MAADKIYTIVSAYYKNKGLDKNEFSNRLYAVKCVFEREWTVKDCIDFLDIREHWWEWDTGDRTRMKNSTRYQIKTIIKK